MQTAVFGFDAFVCDVGGLQDYYALLDIPCTGSSLPDRAVVTKQLIDQVAFLQQTQTDDLDKFVVSAERAMLQAISSEQEAGPPRIDRFGDIDAVSEGGSSLDDSATELGTCTWVRNGAKGEVPYDQLPADIRLSMLLDFIHTAASKTAPNGILSRPRQEHLKAAISGLLDIRTISSQHLCTPTVARIASLLVAAHNVLADTYERAPLYTRGGHSALYFLQQANRRSQGFFYSPLVGFFAFRYSVPFLNSIRVVVWSLCAAFVALMAWNLDALYPTTSRKNLVSNSRDGYVQYLERQLSFQTVFAPLTAAVAIYCGVQAVSMGRLLHLLGPTGLYKFFVRRANLLRMSIPFLLLSVVMVVQQRLDGDLEGSWWTSLSEAWILAAVLVVVEVLHLTDCFLMPVTIHDEAAVAEQHLRLFGPVQSSPQLHQELNTYYLRSVGVNRVTLLHLLTQVCSGLSGFVCPAVLIALIASTSLSTSTPDDNGAGKSSSGAPTTSSPPTAAATGGYTLTKIEDAPWGWWFIAIHVRIGAWVLASIVGSWVDKRDRDASDRALVESYGASDVFNPAPFVLSPSRWINQLRRFTHATPTRQFILSVVQVLIIGSCGSAFVVLMGIKLTNVQVCSFMVVAVPLLFLCGLALLSSIYCLVACVMQPRYLPEVVSHSSPSRAASPAHTQVRLPSPSESQPSSVEYEMIATQRSRNSVSSTSEHSPLPAASFSRLNPYAVHSPTRYLSASNANHRQPTPRTTTNDSFATLSIKSESSGLNATAQHDEVHLRPLSAFALHQAAGSRSPASPSPCMGDRPDGQIKHRRSDRTVRITEDEPHRDLRASQVRADGRPTLDAAVAELHASFRTNRSKSPCQH